MKALRIIKWNEVHEDANSRRLIKLRYMQVPVGRESEGWECLSVMTGGLQARGVYLELAEFAATLPIRGVLASQDKPLARAVIARRCRVSFEELNAALELMMSEQIAFIDEVDFPPDPRLVLTTHKNSKPLARIILPYSLTADGELVDFDGNPPALINDSPAPSPVSPALSEENPGHAENIARTFDESARTFPEKPRSNLDNVERGTRNRKRETGNVELGTRIRTRDQGNFSSSTDTDTSDGVGLGAARNQAYQSRYLPAMSALWGRKAGARLPADSPEAAADRTVTEQWWDDWVWPEDEVDVEVASQRMASLLALIGKAKLKKTPMAWLTSCVNKQREEAA